MNVHDADTAEESVVRCVERNHSNRFYAVDFCGITFFFPTVKSALKKVNKLQTLLTEELVDEESL
jgi:hypothetical protein